VVGLVVIGLVAWWFVTHARTRRRDLLSAQEEAARLGRALLAIERHADQWRDVDSVLATLVREEIRQFRAETRSVESERVR
jgi:hypothetical protein